MPDSPQLIFTDLSFLYLFILVRKEKKITEIIQNNGQKRPFIHKGLLDQHIVRPLNEAFQHRDAVTSCTSRKHCRIAPYRSLILNVPVFSQLLKVCM